MKEINAKLGTWYSFANNVYSTTGVGILFQDITEQQARELEVVHDQFKKEVAKILNICDPATVSATPFAGAEGPVTG